MLRFVGDDGDKVMTGGRCRINDCTLSLGTGERRLGEEERVWTRYELQGWNQGNVEDRYSISRLD
jgi:hypothetical protein